MILKKTNEEPIEVITDLSTTVNQISSFLLDFQQRLCAGLEALDEQATFKPDPWQHPQGGGGISCVLENGKVIEKAGVNFSHVLGLTLPTAATLKRPDLANAKFQALGVSSVIHPLNPFVPTSHLNVRFIAVEKEDGQITWWFGGGFDLTPYYGFAEDCKHWHRTAKAACDPFGEEVYPRYKKWCDDYFFLPHRNEPRGIGGIFFDDLNSGGFERCFAFMQSVGNAFIDAYLPIVAKRKSLAYNQQQQDFQHYRRGRYVEFNLLYDRGTLFGLQSGGRTESILMSLPQHVAWHYNWQPEPNTPEANLYKEFLLPRDWL